MTPAQWSLVFGLITIVLTGVIIAGVLWLF